MALVLFDTNILIDHFNQHNQATSELTAYSDAIISSLTWIEVACGFDQTKRIELSRVLSAAKIRVVHIDDVIMLRAAVLRSIGIANQSKVKLVDCIIRATAEVSRRILVTRNPKDFGGEGPMVHVPYQINNGKVVAIRPRPR